LTRTKTRFPGENLETQRFPEMLEKNLNGCYPTIRALGEPE